MLNRNIDRAVITGPTGTVGSALCKRLLAENIIVYAVVRPETKRLSSLPSHPNLHIVRCDVANLKELPNLIPENIDAFFHLAWEHTIGPGRNDMHAQVDNINHSLDAVNAAVALGCKVFLGAGSQAECGRVEGILRPETPCFPENGYGMAKLCAGQMTRLECEKLGIDHIWIRILSIYGPCDGPATMISSTVKALLAGEKPRLTAGEQQWDYLYSADVAKGFHLAAMHGGNGAIYPLGSGVARPLKEYVKIIRDQIDPKLELGFGELPYAPKQVMHLQADISALSNDTGFYPEYTFEKGIRETIEWMKNQK